MVSRKKEEFLQGESKYKGPNRVVILLFVLVAVAGVATFVLLNQSSVTAVQRWEGGNYNIGKSRDYDGRTINMTTVANSVEDGKIKFPLEEVINKELVYTVYKNKEGRELPLVGTETPLLAYISPAGRLVTALAICEPCRSLSFHIEGNKLVCDTCGTRWLLNDLAGISGGCTLYPPEELPYQVEAGTVMIDESVILSWNPRE